MFLLFENASSGSELIESKMLGRGMPKAKIRTILQTCDEVNGNKRIYGRTLLERGINEIMPKVKSKYLVGELDHPVPTGNDVTDSYRHFVVLYEKASHVFNDVTIEGNNIMGTIETTTTDNGFKMAGLIMDGINVGFSLRATGEAKTRSDGICEVVDPFSVITYDCVSTPSHASARMIDIVRETKEPDRIENYINENMGMISYDRLDLLCGNTPVQEKNIKAILENGVRDIETNIKEGRINEADDIVHKLLGLYCYNEEEFLKPDMTRYTSVVDFFGKYIQGKMPLEDAFKKTLGSK